ncbi:DUF6675 family protein [Treponema sp.]|uniref:DUF6675 family protein n=1 Tax=Treponema sp. TaxID=166 RepID=UPI0025F879B2|nr:DUF6675 family protein [Treponema sp.]MCR5217676.1 hypothetical protein [Treponema sp.]
MKKTFIKLMAACLFSASAALASAYSVSDLVSSDVLKALKKDGTVTSKKFKENNTDLVLLPTSESSSYVSSMWTYKKDPVLIQENLYLISKSSLNETEPEAVNIKKASKIIRSISKMQGMKYFSHSSEDYETLYKEAYCVSGPKSKTKVIDKTSGSADGKVLYAYLNDNSLGKTIYELKYHQTEEEVSVTFENTTDVDIGPITAVDDGNLHIGLVIYDCGDDFLVYTVVEARFPSLSFLEDRMNESLSARMIAIYEWFIKQF